MASDLSVAEYVIDQIRDAGDVKFKKMFGEFAIYCDGKVVALICDNQLFVKPSDAGRQYLQEIVEAFPYPGVKTAFFLIGDALDDREYISKLVQVTAAQLPMPKPKPKPAKKKKPSKAVQ